MHDNGARVYNVRMNRTSPACYRCGSFDIVLVLDDDSSAVCEPCDDQFRAALALEFPFGQCQQCGVAYRELTCELGKIHVFANHVEGACGAWSDSPYEEVPAGHCSLGCAPKIRLEDLPLDADTLELPF